MQSKLSRYCDGIMEAGWLAAVILVPIFFDIYSSRIFEPDKITLLRSLGLLIALAWIVKTIEQGGIRWDRLDPGEHRFKQLLRIPLILPTLAIAGPVHHLNHILDHTERQLLGFLPTLAGDLHYPDLSGNFWSDRRKSA